MRPRLLLLVLLAACGDRSPLADPSVRVTIDASEVELGRAFPLTVVRTRNRGEPDAWSEEALRPLTVRLVESSQRRNDARVEETRRYRAYAFAPGVIDVSGTRVRIKPTLDPAAPGPPELPGGPLEGSRTWWLWVLAGAVAAVLLLRRRRPDAPPPPAPEAPAPHHRALEELARLRARQPRGPEEIGAFYVDATDIVREYAGTRFVVDAERMTTEQLVDVAGGLRAFLPSCDLVKFARHLPGVAERERMLAQAERFVKGTA